MIDDYLISLRRKIDAFMAEKGISTAKFGFLCANNHKLISQLNAGSMTINTVRRIENYLSDNKKSARPLLRGEKVGARTQQKNSSCRGKAVNGSAECGIMVGPKDGKRAANIISGQCRSSAGVSDGGANERA